MATKSKLRYPWMDNPTTANMPTAFGAGELPPMYPNEQNNFTPQPPDGGQATEDQPRIDDTAQRAQPVNYAGSVGQFKIGGANADKLNDPTHDSPKYQLLRTLSHFDPTKGLTPDVEAALDALGLGDFEIVGPDKLRINNPNKAWGQLYGDLDVIAGFKSGGDAWGSGLSQATTNPADAAKQLLQPGGSDGGFGSGGVGGGGNGGAGGGSSSTRPFDPSVAELLRGIIGGGGNFNQNLVNNQVESARELLEKRRSGEVEAQQASLASRGVLGSGVEGDALSRLGERLNTDFGGDVRDIYSDEMGRADSRLVEALSLLTGMTISEASNAVQMAGIASNERTAGNKLDLDRTLGLGQLALGNLNAVNDYNLDLGRLGLDRDVAQYNIDSGIDQQTLDILLGMINNNKPVSG